MPTQKRAENTPDTFLIDLQDSFVLSSPAKPPQPCDPEKWQRIAGELHAQGLLHPFRTSPS